jgi:hypothetical protein
VLSAAKKPLLRRIGTGWQSQPVSVPGLSVPERAKEPQTGQNLEEVGTT